MEIVDNWHCGFRNYKKQTFIQNTTTKQNTFITDLLDVETTGLTNIFDLFALHVDDRKSKSVDLLFSGGLDSECVLYALLSKNIPCNVYTLRLMLNGFPVNTHDLYYSEKFCRQNDIKQHIIDLDIEKFYGSGDYLQYTRPYNLYHVHVATLLWLITKCDNFIVMGGDYTWPWAHKHLPNQQTLLSPHKFSFNYYDRWLQKNNIEGIGSMINHSIDSNILFMKAHLDLYNEDYHGGDQKRIPVLKRDILHRLGFPKFELRTRSYGWENIPKELFNIYPYGDIITEAVGRCDNNIISWNNLIGDALGIGPGTNNRFI